MRHRGALVELLRRYPEVMPAFGSAGGGSGDGTPAMPAVWKSREFQELERVLLKLRLEDGVARRHVLARYCGERVQLRCRRVDGRLVGLPRRSEPLGRPVAVRGDMAGGFQLVSVVAITWPRWVDERVVGRGVDAMLEWYRGVPRLPSEMVAG